MGEQGGESLMMEKENEEISCKRKCCFFSSKVFVVFLGFVAVSAVAGYMIYFIKSEIDEYYETESAQPALQVCDSQSGSDDELMEETEMVDIRLPRSIKPLHYHVKLIPFINGNFSIHGHSEMTFEVLENTRNVTMHINGIITNNATVKLTHEDATGGQGIPIKKHVYDVDRQFYVALLNDDLKAGMRYVISMDFIGFLNDNMNGFYRSSYTDESGKVRWIAGTQFQPTDARKAFPCLDEPHLKANFTIELAREKTMTAISNMPISESVPMEGSSVWYWDKFETTVPMSTYLVAFVVSDFTYIKSIKNNTYDFKVWARKSAINQADYALQIGPQATEFFEEYFQVHFPLPKQDMVALPDFAAGAMENWGLITYRETAMLYDPKISKASDKAYVAKVIVHEVSHQWFGNLVTPSWWTGLWLNEGFASYMEHVGLNGVDPAFDSIRQFVIDKLHVSFAIDCLESSHPINIKVRDPAQTNDRISYWKGASIIRMMHQFLGEKTFRNGLSNYLIGLSYSSAVQDDLWHYLMEQAVSDRILTPDMSVKAIMDTWTLQMGFPVITVTRIKDQTVALRQERFLLVKNENSTDKHDYKWWVPITFASKSNPNFSVMKPKEWMAPTDTTKVISGVPNDDWVIFNVQQTGYYRVNYDQANWNGIADQLIHDHKVIHPLNRAQILNDVFSLARAGMVPYQIVMKVLSYLKNEEDFVPWQAALDGINFIKDMFSHSGGFGALKEFALSLAVPLYNKVGFSDSVTDPHMEQRKRELILSIVCNLGFRSCEQEAVALFNKWKADPNNDTIISPNLKSVVFCTAVKVGGYEEWHLVWQKFLKVNSASEQKMLLTALGCSRESWILRGFLERSLTDGKGIRRQDIRTAFASVAKMDHGKVIAWEFFKENSDRLFKLFGNSFFSLDSIVKAVTKSLNTRNHLMELKNFQKDNRGKFGPAKLAVKQSVENAVNNLHWIENYYHTILAWLTDSGYMKIV